MTFIKINGSEGVEITNNYFDGPGEHIDATNVKDLRASGNTHLDTSAAWRSFTEEVLNSGLGDQEKKDLLDEAKTILGQPTHDQVGKFKIKLKAVGAVAVQFFTQLAANVIGNSLK